MEKGSAISCYSGSAVEIHCYIHRQHILQPVLTHFLKELFLWPAWAFLRNAFPPWSILLVLLPVTIPGSTVCPRSPLVPQGLPPESCYPPTIPWGVLGSDQQCLYKWLLHSSIPLAPVYGPAGKWHYSRSCFSDRTFPVWENIKPDGNADTQCSPSHLQRGKHSTGEFLKKQRCSHRTSVWGSILFSLCRKPRRESALVVRQTFKMQEHSE